MAVASSVRQRVLEEVAQSCILPVKIDSVADYQDGKHLQTLVERLSGKKFPKRISMQKKNPIEAFLKSKGVPMTGKKGFAYPLSNDEVYTYLEDVCLHYKVTVPCREALPHFMSNDPRECLLNWLSINMPPGAKILQGFHDTKWKTGEYFAALIHAKSDGDKYKDWNFEYGIITLNVIFRDAAHCLLGINSLLTQEDFGNGEVHETAIMLYVAQFVNAQYVSRNKSSVDEEKTYYERITSKPVAKDNEIPINPGTARVGEMPSNPRTNRVYENINYAKENVDYPDEQTESHYDLPVNYICRKDLSVQFDIRVFEGTRDMEAAWSHLEEKQKEQIYPFFRKERCFTRFDPIAQGISGNVYKGRFKDGRVHMLVAAKSIFIAEKENAHIVQKKWGDVFTEIYNMAQLDHENVVELIAVVICDKLPHLIMPLLEQNLLEYVSSKTMEIPKAELNTKVLDVANALEYLSELGYIHRDVAARNCMIDKNGSVKLGDLGLMRDNFTYIDIGQSTLAYHWSAPEVLKGEPSSSMSDVWSFGVLYWEVLSLGEEPYKEIRNLEKLTRFLESGDRLQKPESATDNEYKLMQDCWEHKPKDRPKFSQIVKQLCIPSPNEKYSTSTNREQCNINPQVMNSETPKVKPLVKLKPMPRIQPSPIPAQVHSVQPTGPVQGAQAHTDCPEPAIASTLRNANGNSRMSAVPPQLPPRNRNMESTISRNDQEINQIDKHQVTQL